MSILSSAVSSASYNMLLQVSFRLLTFIMNAYIIRFVSHETLGIINVRMMLLYTTVLFVAREAFRRACMKTPQSKEKLASIVNILWIIPIFGALITIVVALIWINLLTMKQHLLHNYQSTVVIYSFATFIELMVEPFFIIGQMYMFVKLKVVVEAIMLSSRCFFTVILVTFTDLNPLLAFSTAMLISTSLYALSYTIFMVSRFKHQVPEIHNFRQLLPNFSAKPDGEVKKIVFSFLKQSLVKQVLTESEKYVMTLCAVLSFSDQGIYDIISNLGSLAARFLFLPLEDASYLYFSQKLSRGNDNKKQQDCKEGQLVLGYLLKVVCTIGLVFLTFGFNYSFLLLDLYGGSRLSTVQGVMLLQSYCGFVLLLAVNGISECFMFATMQCNEIDKYNYNLFYLSICLLAASWYFTKTLGAIGFLLANSLNMAIRIFFSLKYIRKYYETSAHPSPISSLKPKKLLLVTLTLSFVITYISRLFLCDASRSSRLEHLFHVAIGGGCFIGVLASVYISEWDMIQYAKKQVKERTKIQ